MGDSTEEMMNVTIKRLQFIMDNMTPEEALNMEAHNLIDAAIVLLKTNTEEMDAGKVLAHWNSLQYWAKDLYIASLKVQDGKFVEGKFHLSGRLMRMLCFCKIRGARMKKEMKEAIKEADIEETHQPQKVMKYKNGRSYFAER